MTKMKKNTSSDNSAVSPINFMELSDIKQRDSAINITMTIDDFNLFLTRLATYVVSTISERSAREKSTLRYTVDEVVEKLKVSKPTLNKWEKRGYLVPMRIGRRVFYFVDEVDEISLNHQKK